MTVITRARALMDLDEIAEYIGRTNPQAALRFLDAFDQTVAALAPTPKIGSPHETSHIHLEGIRIWPVREFKRYLIFYRPREDGIEVLRVLQGTRDIDTILEGGEA